MSSRAQSRDLIPRPRDGTRHTNRRDPSLALRMTPFLSVSCQQLRYTHPHAEQGVQMLCYRTVSFKSIPFFWWASTGQ